MRLNSSIRCFLFANSKKKRKIVFSIRMILVSSWPFGGHPLFFGTSHLFCSWCISYNSCKLLYSYLHSPMLLSIRLFWSIARCGDTTHFFLYKNHSYKNHFPNFKNSIRIIWGSIIGHQIYIYIFFYAKFRKSCIFSFLHRDTSSATSAVAFKHHLLHVIAFNNSFNENTSRFLLIYLRIV